MRQHPAEFVRPIPIDGKIAFPCDDDRRAERARVKEEKGGSEREREGHLLLEAERAEAGPSGPPFGREGVTGSDIAVGYASTHIPRDACRAACVMVMVAGVCTCGRDRAASPTGLSSW